jgi:hypothetical protein
MEVLIDVPQEAMVGPNQVVLGRAPPFRRREVETGDFDRCGHVRCVLAFVGFWRSAGQPPYKGRVRVSEAGVTAGHMLKSLLGNPVFQFLLGRLIGGYMLFVGVTTRWTKVNRAAVEPFW